MLTSACESFDFVQFFGYVTHLVPVWLRGIVDSQRRWAMVRSRPCHSFRKLPHIGLQEIKSHEPVPIMHILMNFQEGIDFHLWPCSTYTDTEASAKARCDNHQDFADNNNCCCSTYEIATNYKTFPKSARNAACDALSWSDGTSRQNRRSNRGEQVNTYGRFDVLFLKIYCKENFGVFHRWKWIVEKAEWWISLQYIIFM